MKIPTDLEILERIYKDYIDEFVSFKKEENNRRNSKVYVPIDVDKIGKALKVDGDIIFGRLHYHLNRKFGYRNEDGSKVDFFALRIGDLGKEDVHCVQFPYLVSVLADLKYENKKFKTATLIAIASFIVSIISVTISVLA